MELNYSFNPQTTSSTSSIMELFETKYLVKFCAPMVRYSKLQFRTLARLYDSDVCCTPMIMADSFCLSEEARQNEFTTNLADRPLVVQFASKTINDFVTASQIVQPFSDGVDLNCGCPQRWAIKDGYGCALLKNPELISDLVRQCRATMPNSYTISTKIRILDDEKKTLNLCQNLEKAGVSYIVVHGRTASQKNEPVNLNQIRMIKDATKIPIVFNGDILNLDHIKSFKQITNCDGFMAARGMLSNPAMFMDLEVPILNCVQNWIDICYNSVNEYKDSEIENIAIDQDINLNDFLSEFEKFKMNNRVKIKNKVAIKNENSKENLEFPIDQKIMSFQCFHHHLVFMFEKHMTRYQKREFNNLKTFNSVCKYLKETYQITPTKFYFKLYSIIKTKQLQFSKQKVENNLETKFCSNEQDGKYFLSKINDDIFEDEEMSECLSKMYM